MRVDIGIACNKNQEKEWWARLVPELLRVAAAGEIELGRFIAVGSALTDHNRNHIVGHFLEGEGEAIWWIDDDVVPPAGTLEALVGLDVDIAAGCIFCASRPAIRWCTSGGMMGSTGRCGSTSRGRSSGRTVWAWGAR